MPSTRAWKLTAAEYATANKLVIPKGIHPNAPGIGKPTRALLAEIERFAHLRVDGERSTQLELLLFPSELNELWRDQIVAEARLLERRKAYAFYSEGGLRLFFENRVLPTPPQRMYYDCSAGVIMCYSHAWLRNPRTKVFERPADPSGLGYNGEGNTTSLVQHGQHITLATARHGDIGVYVLGESTIHAVLFMDDDPSDNRLVWSMGHQGDPTIKPLSVENDAHAGQRLVCLRTLH